MVTQSFNLMMAHFYPSGEKAWVDEVNFGRNTKVVA